MKKIFTILFFLIAKNSISQMTISYSMSVVGNDLKINSTSNPLILNMNDCIKISNGVSKFFNANYGEFDDKCDVKIIYEKLILKVAPNPFVESVNITFNSKKYPDNFYTLSVSNVEGQLVKNEKVPSVNFEKGYKLKMSELSIGIYFLRVSSNSVNQVVKIIKN